MIGQHNTILVGWKSFHLWGNRRRLVVAAAFRPLALIYRGEVKSTAINDSVTSYRPHSNVNNGLTKRNNIFHWAAVARDTHNWRKSKSFLGPSLEEGPWRPAKIMFILRIIKRKDRSFVWADRRTFNHALFSNRVYQPLLVFLSQQAMLGLLQLSELASMILNCNTTGCITWNAERPGPYPDLTPVLVRTDAAGRRAAQPGNEHRHSGPTQTHHQKSIIRTHTINWAETTAVRSVHGCEIWNRAAAEMNLCSGCGVVILPVVSDCGTRRSQRFIYFSC